MIVSDGVAPPPPPEAPVPYSWSRNDLDFNVKKPPMADESRFTDAKGLLLRCVTDIFLFYVYLLGVCQYFLLVFCTAGYCSVKHVN